MGYEVFAKVCPEPSVESAADPVRSDTGAGDDRNAGDVRGDDTASANAQLSRPEPRPARRRSAGPDGPHRAAPARTGAADRLPADGAVPLDPADSALPAGGGGSPGAEVTGPKMTVSEMTVSEMTVSQMTGREAVGATAVAEPAPLDLPDFHGDRPGWWILPIVLCGALVWAGLILLAV